MSEPLEILSKMNSYTSLEQDDSLIPLGESSAAGQGCVRSKMVERGTSELPIYRAVLPNGGRIPLLKTVLTSVCEKNCYYCAFRKGRDFERFSFIPDEMAVIFMNLYRAGAVKGLFLSSGVTGGGMMTQDKLLATAEILRQKMGFTGYLHLKVMPGSDRAQIERAMQLADRVSVNLEAPTTTRLEQLAPMKAYFEELLRPLKWIEEIRKNTEASKGWRQRWPSSTTQFVVGGAGETDLELLQSTEYLTQQLKLSRVYYSGFNPISGTPLEHNPACSQTRKYRLYQASFLLRDYQYSLEDIPFSVEGGLPTDVDPKMAWAKQNLIDRKIEINQADYQELLKIPGIGPKSAKSILNGRIRHPFKQIEELKAFGIQINRASPFIMINGRQAPQQPGLF